MIDLAHRRSILTAALGFVLLDTKKGKPASPEVQTVRKWLDNRRGVGDVVTGMNRQGYRLHLPNVEEAHMAGDVLERIPVAADGFGADATPWRAVQVAA